MGGNNGRCLKKQNVDLREGILFFELLGFYKTRKRKGNSSIKKTKSYTQTGFFLQNQIPTDIAPNNTPPPVDWNVIKT